MRIGILEIMALPSTNFVNNIYDPIVNKQLASVTSQAISVWCRQLGHETFYATYYGYGNIRRFLPGDLDLVFISCTTPYSPLSYVMAKFYRKAGVRTVFGGHHAKAFPADSLRFFDLVVKECDKNLIKDIIAGHFEPGSYISSAKPFEELPTVEERMPEIRASAFIFKKWRSFMTLVPMLTSMGCPYTCNFCTDWNKPYRLLSLERLKADLAYLSKNFPSVRISFCDPNFAVKFDRVFEALETVPPGSRIPYLMNCSQSILNPSRIKRIMDTNCELLMLGVESWDEYSDKAGFGRKSSAMEKFNRTIENFQLLKENEWFLQANFIFGLDTDCGEGPVTMIKEFIRRTPYSWPAVNIPMPFGGTPLQEKLHAEGRILKEMPFNYYVTPNLAITIKNYDLFVYFEKLIEISEVATSDEMLKQRMKNSRNWKHKFINHLRSMGQKSFANNYRKMAERLRTDREFRAFHEGKPGNLPECYHQEYERQLGPYASLLSREDRRPNIEQMAPLIG